MKAAKACTVEVKAPPTFRNFHGLLHPHSLKRPHSSDVNEMKKRSITCRTSVRSLRFVCSVCLAVCFVCPLFDGQDAPCVLPTTAPLSYLNLDDLTALLKASGNGDLVSLQTWSRDAGSYYCNDQFFRTLHAIRSGTPAGSSLLPVSLETGG